jgi:hypothetical protein
MCLVIPTPRSHITFYLVQDFSKGTVKQNNWTEDTRILSRKKMLPHWQVFIMQVASSHGTQVFITFVTVAVPESLHILASFNPVFYKILEPNFCFIHVLHLPSHRLLRVLREHHELCDFLLSLSQLLSLLALFERLLISLRRWVTSLGLPFAAKGEG